MENMRRWINYDWFKLIVALILLVIFIVLLLRAPAPNAVVVDSVSPTAAAAAATATEPVAAAPTASPTAPPPTATAPQPTATVPPPTATAQPEAPQAPSPTPTATPATQQPAPASGDCSKALSTRLDVGKKAQVVFDLNLRAEAGMDKKITLTNLPGARLDIIGGPVCIPYGSGTYRWWNVKMTNGTTGWSAEGSLTGKRYFMEPVP